MAGLSQLGQLSFSSTTTIRFPKANRKQKPLWRCPKCGHRFVTKNLWHSCGRYRIGDHFIGKPPVLRQTFKSYVGLARACGPIIVYAQKSRIVIQGRVRFAGAVVRRDWLDATMWLKRRVHHACLRRVESFGTLGYGHHFHLKDPGDVDKSLAEYMKEAYTIGQQAALDRPEEAIQTPAKLWSASRS